ncbi:hypothetical protein TNCV_3479501 [Trichonephila clavipes]|nr:hypothetical protein TNCV_3479501 [Trichonephila clavipes]
MIAQMVAKITKLVANLIAKNHANGTIAKFPLNRHYNFSQPSAGETFKSRLTFVDLQMIVSRLRLSPQPLSLVSPQLNHWCGYPTDSVILS